MNAVETRCVGRYVESGKAQNFYLTGSYFAGDFRLRITVRVCERP